MDAKSKWIEVLPMSSTTAEATVEALRFVCSAHGLLEEIVQFFDSAHLPCSRGFFCCCGYIISGNMYLFKVWSEDKLNKKFIVAEIFAELVSKGIKAILFIFVYFVSVWRDRMLHATSDRAD